MLSIYLFLACMMCNLLYHMYGFNINWIFPFANHKWMTRIQKFKRMIKLHFLLNLSNIENIYLFQEVLRFLFHTWEAMGNEIYKQHGFLSYMYIVCWCCWALFNGFGNNNTSQKIYIFTNHSIFSFVCSIHRCIFTP